jgi:hypothetical protein
MNMIRKGQVRWLPKNDIAGQPAFVGRLFRLALATLRSSSQCTASYRLSFRLATRPSYRPPPHHCDDSMTLD